SRGLDPRPHAPIVLRLSNLHGPCRMPPSSIEPTPRRFHGAGVEIAAEEAGPDGGRPVLLLHGGGQTRGAWGGALREGARRGYRMVSADLRGHGDSGWAK